MSSSNNHFVDKNRVEKYNYYATHYNGLRDKNEHDDYPKLKQEFYNKRRGGGCGRMLFFILFVVMIIALIIILSNKNTV